MNHTDHLNQMVQVESPQTNGVPRSQNSPESDRFAFERTQFSRADFTVQRFIYLAGKRSNLESIHSDLRAYLRELQNSMVGLINDDYADFVNLSSKLAALKDSIDKVSGDLNSAWTTFGNSTTSIRKTSEATHKKSNDLTSSRSRQLSIRNKIALLNSIEKLADCLSNRPSDTSKKWYIKFLHLLTSVEFWHLRIPGLEIDPKVAIARETCFMRAKNVIASDLVDDLRGECRLIGLIITSLQIIGQLEYGMAVTKDLVMKSIDANGSVGSNETLKLEIFYERVFKLRKRWIDNCRDNNQLIKEVEYFLDDALLKFILDHLDENIGELCIPTETEIFFESYNSTVKFAQSFPHISKHRNFLKGLNDRFNLQLYVKRVSTLLNEEVLAKTANTRIVWNDSVKYDEHPLEAPNAILKAIEHVFSPNVFLAIVADRFWDSSIQLVNKHSEWLDYCLSAEPTRIVDELSGSVTIMERWPDLIALLSGSKKFDSQFFDLCLKTIFKKFEQIGADPGLFRQFLSEYSTKMEAKRGDIRSKILDHLLESAVKRIQAGVVDIQKRYRWTKKPSPTEPSPYIAEALEVQSSFGETATRLSLDPEQMMEMSGLLLNGMIDSFLTNSQQVLSSVQLTGSSLQRFKRKGLVENTQNGSFGETDETKISKQLYLDTQKMKEHAETANVKLESLDAFLKQLENQEST